MEHLKMQRMLHATIFKIGIQCPQTKRHGFLCGGNHESSAIAQC